MHTLMIVDDSNIIRRKISRCNIDDKFDVVATAGDGVEAVRKYKIHKPSVVTMDLTMPQMEGQDCIKELVKLDPDIKILVVSALSDKATGIKALELGAQGFLCKPFTEDELRVALNELIED